MRFRIRHLASLLICFSIAFPVPAFSHFCEVPFAHIGSPNPFLLVNPMAARSTSQDLKSILSNVLSTDRQPGPLTGAEFNELFDQLSQLAQENGIKLSHRKDVIGVFPKGLHEIQLSGFGKAEDLDKPVSFAASHELGHLFHTIQCRLTLIRTLGPRGEAPTSLDHRSSVAYLAHLESDGANYRQFEKAVGGASSLAHYFRPGARDAALYRQRIEGLIDGVELSLRRGKVEFPNGKTLEEVYALFLSKAPIVVGTSAAQMAVRLPFIVFSALVLVNQDVESVGIDPQKWGVKGKRKKSGGMGFRDFLIALIFPSQEP